MTGTNSKDEEEEEQHIESEQDRFAPREKKNEQDSDDVNLTYLRHFGKPSPFLRNVSGWQSQACKYAQRR